MEPTDASHAALSWLWGARIQRVDGPRPGCSCLALYDRGDKQFLVLLYGSDGRGVGALRDRPKGQAASSFVQRLRGELEGARLTSAHWLTSDPNVDARASSDTAEGRANALLLTCQHGARRARIVVDFDAKAPNLFLLRDDGTIAIAASERLRRERQADRKLPYAPGGGRGIARIESSEALFQAGESLLGATARQADESARKQAQARARAALKRVERKVDAIRGDLARAESAPLLRREAQLLLGHLGEIPRGASAVRLLDQSVDPPTYLTIALDPAKDARQLAQQRFDRARRLQRGVAIASGRLAEAEREQGELRTLLERLTSEPLESIAAQTGGALVAEVQRAAGKKVSQRRISYRTFASADGQRILVGKGAADNDTLTLTIARPHDHWLHVRGVAGSHVVVPLERKAAIGQELLLDAAHLAAHFSKQRGEPLVEIAHTARRFVRKAKGAAPGSVQVDKERVFVLRVEPERLARLLASERA